jgi:RNA polymerase sigma factor (sigma-70 family)
MEDLIKKAQAGDEQAVEKIINKYMPLVISEASKYHIPGYDFEDIVQHSILSIIKSIMLYNVGSKSFSTFMSNTVKNNNINLLKGTIKHHREVQDQSILDNIIHGYGFTLEDEVIAHDMVDKLTEALNKLANMDKQVIVDFYIKRKKIKDIAKEYGVLEKEAYAMKKLAIKKLKRFL